MIAGLLAGVLAQTCVALLPPPRAEIEWFRDGQPFARDVPLRTSRSERVYRREPSTGRPIERSLVCSTTNGVTYLTERVGNTSVRLPVPLTVGSASRVDGTTVRRVAPPADASGPALWYTVASPGIHVYAVRNGAGVVEIRSPAAGGGFSILRAVTRVPAAIPHAAIAAVRAEADSQRSALERRVEELEQTVRQLQDSLAVLRAARPPPVAYSNRTRYRALEPYTADLIERLLRRAVPPEQIVADARRACVAFLLTPDHYAAFLRAGAPVWFADSLSAVCRMPARAAHDAREGTGG